MPRRNFTRKFGYIPSLPNVDSKFRTVASTYIDNHYAHLLIRERWTWERYTRLCRFLNYTPYELASIVMLAHRYVEPFHRRNVLEPKHASVALLLTVLEAHMCGKMTYDVIENPFPDLNKTG